MEKFDEEHHRSMWKDDFASIFGLSYLEVFTVELCKLAFSKTGIYPYDPTVIKPSQLAPSEGTSISGSFPQVQPSPVRAIMAVHRLQLPTSMDDDSTNLDPAVDPVLYTPSKRMRLMNASIASTSSGSFLVSSRPMVLTVPIIKPVFETPLALEEPD